jgi:mono/diheme cytochrome c family protein
MRIEWVISVLVIAAILPLASCVQKMGTEGRLLPMGDQEAQSLVARHPPDGTVPQNETEGDSKIRPLLSKGLLQKGREHFEIYCALCHGMTGQGDGIVVQRGFLAPPSYHIDRLRKADDQHFYDVITQGYGAMYSYGDRIDSENRWAIVAYIRALQLSQHFRVTELTATDRAKLLQEAGP